MRINHSVLDENAPPTEKEPEDRNTPTAADSRSYAAGTQGSTFGGGEGLQLPTAAGDWLQFSQNVQDGRLLGRERRVCELVSSLPASDVLDRLSDKECIK